MHPAEKRLPVDMVGMGWADRVHAGTDFAMADYVLIVGAPGPVM